MTSEEKQAAEAEELVTVMATPVDTKTIEPCGLCGGSGKKTSPAALEQLVPHEMTMNCPRCWGRGTVPAGFLPADVVLRVPPLTDTMGRSVIESAAGLLVAVLALRGNKWRPVLWSDVRDVMMAASAAGEPQSGEDTVERFCWDVGRNPFIRPNFNGLVARGFATRDEATEAIAFTPEGIAAMAKWVHMPAAVVPAAAPVVDCSSCGEDSCKPNECPKSRRPCGHHCNCSWSQDQCCWCGKEFGEAE